MSNSGQRLLISLVLLTLGMAGAPAALAKGPPIKVTEAIPAEASQGDLNLPVTLKGGPFDGTATVTFIVSATGVPDPGRMHTKNIVFHPDTGDLQFDLDVAVDANPGDYDIEVELLSGRKGKGTSLFHVQARQNQNLVDCAEFAPNGTCTCIFNKDEDLRIFHMEGDCQTAETLVLNHARILSGGSTPSEQWPVLTAVNGPDGHFRGSAVIANRDDAVGVRYLNIRFDKDVSRGCDLVNDDIQSALSFVLDENTFDNPETASGLHVWDLTIDTHDGVDNDPLCTAIEVVREPGFTDPSATGNGNKDGQVFVTNVEIADGSFERVGIRYEGFQPLGSVNPPLVNGNVIGAQACGPESDTARAIQFGRLQLSDASDPSSRIAGVVESNTIGMATDCGPGAVGILVVGEQSDPAATTVEIVKNSVQGAYVGALIDRNVAEANLSGNTLTGDFVDETTPLGDIGVCSDIQPPGVTSTKGKPNKIDGYDDLFVYGNEADGWCLPLP